MKRRVKSFCQSKEGTHTLDKEDLNSSSSTLSVDKKIDLSECKTGDLILFSRSCPTLGLYGGLICVGGKFIGQSCWDHLGVVIRDTKDNQLYLLEASLRGVVSRPLAERVARSRATDVALRRLQVCATPEQQHEAEKNILAFVNDVMHRPYESRWTQLAKASVRVPSRAERERLVRSLQQNTEMQQELQRHDIIRNSSSSAKNLDNEAMQKLEVERKKLESKLAQSEVSVFENQEDLSQLFCSELVAAVYQAGGWLPPYPPSNSFIPAHFTSDSVVPLPLMPHVTLMPEIQLRKKQQRLSSSSTKMDASILSKLEWFQGLDNTNDWATKFESVSFERGEIVYQQNDEKALYIVQSGGEFEAIEESCYKTDTFRPGMTFGHLDAKECAVRARVPSRAWKLPSSEVYKLKPKRKKLTKCEQEWIVNHLKDHPVFEELSQDKLQDAASRLFFPLNFSKGSSILEKGDGSENLYLIAKGSSCSCCNNSDNSSVAMIPGEFIGEAAMLYDVPTDKSVVAMENDTTVYAISQHSLRHELGLRVSSKSLHALLHRLRAQDGFVSTSDFINEILWKGIVSDSKIQQRRRRINELIRSLLDPNDIGSVSFGQLAHFIFHLQHKSAKDLVPEASEDLQQVIEEDLNVVINLWHGAKDRLQSNESNNSTISKRVNYKEDRDSFEGIVPALASGIIARTATAPLERTKILMQTNSRLSMRNLWTGNALHCAKMIPSFPIKLYFANYFRKELTPSLPTEPRNLIAGGAAGIIALGLLYPLDFARGRVTIAPVNYYRNTWHCLKSAATERHGIKTLYRGFGVSAVGMFTYFGTSFCLYDFMLPLVVRHDDERRSSNHFRSVLCASICAISAQTLSYPFDMVRRRMQVQGNWNTTCSYPEFRSAWHCVKTSISERGSIRSGLYRGWLPNAIKVWPVTIISLTLYDKFLEK